MRRSTRISLIALPLILAAGALIARLQLRTSISLVETIRHPIPAELLFPGSARAGEAAVAFGTLALAALAYRFVVHDAAAIPRRTLVLSSSLAALIGLGWPLVYSADVDAYAAYGVELLHGLNPYAAPVVSSMHVPHVIEYVRAWSGLIPRDIAGPLFTALATAAAAAGEPVSILRILTAAAFVACVRFWPADDPRGAAFFGAHPVVIWAAVEGHNDMLAFLLVVLAWRIAGPVGLSLRVAAAITKAFAIVPLIVELQRVQRNRGLTFAAATAVVSLAYLPMLAGIPADIASGGPRELHFSALGLATLAGAPLELRILAGALVIAIVAVCVIRRRDGAAAAALAAWALFPTAYPWWAVWLVAVVARNPPTPSWAALIGVSFVSVASYLPSIRYGSHIPVIAGGEIAFAGTLLVLIYAIPLLVVGTAQTAAVPEFEHPLTPLGPHEPDAPTLT